MNFGIIFWNVVLQSLLLGSWCSEIVKNRLKQQPDLEKKSAANKMAQASASQVSEIPARKVSNKVSPLPTTRPKYFWAQPNFSPLYEDESDTPIKLSSTAIISSSQAVDSCSSKTTNVSEKSEESRENDIKKIGPSIQNSEKSGNFPKQNNDHPRKGYAEKQKPFAVRDSNVSDQKDISLKQKDKFTNPAEDDNFKIKEIPEREKNPQNLFKKLTNKPDINSDNNCESSKKIEKADIANDSVLDDRKLSKLIGKNKPPTPKLNTRKTFSKESDIMKTKAIETPEKKVQIYATNVNSDNNYLQKKNEKADIVNHSVLDDRKLSNIIGDNKPPTPKLNTQKSFSKESDIMKIKSSGSPEEKKQIYATNVNSDNINNLPKKNKKTDFVEDSELDDRKLSKIIDKNKPSTPKLNTQKSCDIKESDIAKTKNIQSPDEKIHNVNISTDKRHLYKEKSDVILLPKDWALNSESDFSVIRNDNKKSPAEIKKETRLIEHIRDIIADISAESSQKDKQKCFQNNNNNNNNKNSMDSASIITSKLSSKENILRDIPSKNRALEERPDTKKMADSEMKKQNENFLKMADSEMKKQNENFLKTKIEIPSRMTNVDLKPSNEKVKTEKMKVSEPDDVAVGSFRDKSLWVHLQPEPAKKKKIIKKPSDTEQLDREKSLKIARPNPEKKLAALKKCEEGETSGVNKKLPKREVSAPQKSKSLAANSRTKITLKSKLHLKPSTPSLPTSKPPKIYSNSEPYCETKREPIAKNSLSSSKFKEGQHTAKFIKDRTVKSESSSCESEFKISSDESDNISRYSTETLPIINDEIKRKMDRNEDRTIERNENYVNVGIFSSEEEGEEILYDAPPKKTRKIKDSNYPNKKESKDARVGDSGNVRNREPKNFQKTEFQRTEFQKTEFQKTEFQRTEFQRIAMRESDDRQKHESTDFQFLEGDDQSNKKSKSRPQICSTNLLSRESPENRPKTNRHIAQPLNILQDKKSGDRLQKGSKNLRILEPENSEIPELKNRKKKDSKDLLISKFGSPRISNDRRKN